MDIHILVADDDAQQQRYLAAILKASGYVVTCASGGREVVRLLSDPALARFDLLLLDVHMPDLDGIEVLQRLRAAGHKVPVLVLTSDGSIGRAVEAMRAGASDFLVKPAAPERLDFSIRNALTLSELSSEVRRLTQREENRLSFDDLVAVSPATREVIALARRVAGSDIPVLIEGESGTGKEVFARAIHGSSDRAGAPFVAVNCGALPAHLIESILFGHEKGAFTGAVARRAGKFQEASGGTLFLDEIGELPLEAQVKLLRAIQSSEVDPLGAREPVKVDIRLVSASNRDLRAMVGDGTFREDLFYRLSVFPLTLPPLRERRDDLPALARMFLKRFAAAENSAVNGFEADAMELIAHAQWPGNVRQLENTIHRAVVMSDGPLIGLPALTLSGDAAPETQTQSHAGEEATGATESHDCVSLLRGDGHSRRLIDIEAEAITRALALYRGRMSETARRLGIGRSTLYRKIEEFQIGKGAD